jgi:DNA repair protein RadD
MTFLFNMELRPYQNEAVAALVDSFQSGLYGGLLIAPTGAGKSLYLAEIANRLKDKKILVLAHRQELISQNAKEFYNLTGEIPGVWSASLDQKTVRRVTFAQIQSAYRQSWPVDIVLIDEAHCLSSNESSMYQQILDKTNGALLYGLTATPHRLDTGHLVRGQDALFTKTIHETFYNDLVEQGYLAPLIYKTSDCGVSNSDFQNRGKDINQEQVEISLEGKLDRIIADVESKTINRKKVLWFCPTVKIATELSQKISGTLITAETENRAAAILGDWKHLINVEVLTTGFNYPAIDTIVFLRPTKSTALFKQMMGRGTRKAPGKENTLILDYTTNTLCHGFLGDNDYPNAKGRKKDYKVCKACGEITKLEQKECPACGFVWLTKPRATGDPLSGVLEESVDPDNAEQIVPVKSWSAVSYLSMSGKTSLQITFNTTAGKIKKWLPPYGFYSKRFLAQVGGKLGTVTQMEKDFPSWKKPDALIVTRNDKGYLTVLDVG